MYIISCKRRTKLVKINKHYDSPYSGLKSRWEREVVFTQPPVDATTYVSVSAALHAQFSFCHPRKFQATTILGRFFFLSANLTVVHYLCKVDQTTEKSPSIYSPSILTQKEQSIFATLLLSPEWEDIFSLHTFRRGWWIAFNLCSANGLDDIFPLFENWFSRSGSKNLEIV